ncbi:uncharacterized mitochondrial protein AtMg00310-like [Rutidosis leptorrhynchoides]|uniref:uncharacterized mitochondrial protein AtMg00310-like n=1 Tax=Rutidosis leptorrhynchoides TaxID=125765 RepID=UPI003A994634
MGSLGIYFMSLFKCPATILKNLESIRARFFWGGNNSTKKMSWIKWEKILAPFDKGSLNVGSLKAFNLALIFKWRWRYLTCPDDMWVQIIKSIHGPSFESLRDGTSCVWSNIVSTCSKCVSDRLLPSDTLKMGVGNGTSIKFWLDLWVGNTTLATKYNHLYHLDRNPSCSIADKIAQGGWIWSWTRSNLGSRNQEALDLLIRELPCPCLREGSDF